MSGVIICRVIVYCVCVCVCVCETGKGYVLRCLRFQAQGSDRVTENAVIHHIRVSQVYKQSAKGVF